MGVRRMTLMDKAATPGFAVGAVNFQTRYKKTMKQRKSGKTTWKHYVAVACMSIASGYANAQTVKIDLPALPLSEALAKLSQQGKVNILASDASVADRMAPAVSGTLSIHDALDQLLKGTNLKAEQKQEGTWVISASSKQAAVGATNSATVLPAITVTGNVPSDDTGFLAYSSNTATRTDTPISETPQSIQVITADQLKSHQTQSVLDALEMAGLPVVSQSQGNSAAVISRGFTANIMRNGINDLSGNQTALSIPVAGIERIEVIKGADSILAGVMYPGGVVNVVTKQPTADTLRQLTVQTGSYGDWLGAVDLGGPLTPDKHLTYRLVVSGERSGESYGGYDGNKTFYVAPTLGWKSGGTDIVVGYQHQAQNLPATAITLVGPGGPLPLDGRATPPDNQFIKSDTLFYDIKQKLGRGWEVESRTQYQNFNDWSENNYFPFGYDPTSMPYSGATYTTSSSSIETDNHIKTAFQVGSIRNSLMVGGEYQIYRTNTNEIASGVLAPFPSPTLPPVAGKFYNFTSRQYFNNLYLQDQMSWGRLRVLASLARGTSWSTGQPAQSAWLPNIGVLYQLSDYVSVFANTFRSFVPNTFSPLARGAPVPPSLGRSIEAGVKLNLLDDQLSVTAGVFRTAMSNTYYPAPESPSGYLPGENEAYRGAEINVAGQVLPGLNLTFNYTYTTGQQLPTGNLPPVRHMGGLWLSYDLQSEHLRGWGGGIGLQARSSYEIPVQPLVYKIPGQMQTDLNVHYQTRNWSTILGIKNVFNRTLYQDGVYYVNFVTLNPGRLIYLTSSYKF